jgi:23S rRNA (uracil1939-C5)-methyltransferase
MRGCLVDHPGIQACADELVEVGNRLGIEPHRPAQDGRDASGDLRYAWLKTDGREVLLTLISSSRESRSEELAAALTRPAGISWCVQPGSGNALRGQELQHLRGVRSLSTEIAGRSLDVGPLGFLQPNPAVAELAYSSLVREESGRPLRGELAFDLYAGGGITTSLLRDGHAQVIPCESYPESAAALGVAPERVADFLGRMLDEGRRPDSIVANPPRGGLGAQVCEALTRFDPAHLQVMSCNPESLARDLERLSSRYELLRLRAFDTLPHTAHIELVAWLAPRVI